MVLRRDEINVRMCRVQVEMMRIVKLREREFYFSPARPRCEHMAVASEGGMSLRLRGVSKVQAGGPFYLFIVQLGLSSVRSIGYNSALSSNRSRSRASSGPSDASPKQLAYSYALFIHYS